MTILLCILWFIAGLFIGTWIGFKWTALAIALAVRDGQMEKIIKDYKAVYGGDK